jgi:prepilin-type N-terminal cleavage/methylation domain-containing protein
MRERLREQGFTLIELMITVAIIAILAAVAVPAFMKETRKSKASSEVGAVFAELSVREEQYKLENGVYLDAAACPAMAGLGPTSRDATGCIASGLAWNTLRVRLPETNLYCSYEITTGTGTGTNNPGGFTFTSPALPWFYILATCEMDGNTSVHSTYFTSSVDSKVQQLNDGK